MQFRRKFQEALVQSQAKSGSTGCGDVPGQVQRAHPGFQRFASQHASERFVKKTLRLLGIAPELFVFFNHFPSVGTKKKRVSNSNVRAKPNSM